MEEFKTGKSIEKFENSLGWSKTEFSRQVKIARPVLNDIYSGKTETVSAKTSAKVRRLKAELQVKKNGGKPVEADIDDVFILRTNGDILIKNFSSLSDEVKQSLSRSFALLFQSYPSKEKEGQ